MSLFRASLLKKQRDKVFLYAAREKTIFFTPTYVYVGGEATKTEREREREKKDCSSSSSSSSWVVPREDVERSAHSVALIVVPRRRIFPSSSTNNNVSEELAEGGEVKTVEKKCRRRYHHHHHQRQQHERATTFHTLRRSRTKSSRYDRAVRRSEEDALKRFAAVRE